MWLRNAWLRDPSPWTPAHFVVSLVLSRCQESRGHDSFENRYCDIDCTMSTFSDDLFRVVKLTIVAVGTSLSGFEGRSQDATNASCTRT